MSDMPHISLKLSPIRCWFAIIAMVIVGGLVFSIVIQHGARLSYPSLIGAAIVVLGTFWNALGIYRSLKRELVVDDDGLGDGTGAYLTSLNNITQIERGMFTLKPTHGFAVILDTPAKFAWVPGLYWIVGKRIGVGGMVDPAAAKFMAEALTAHIANRGQ